MREARRGECPFAPRTHAPTNLRTRGPSDPGIIPPSAIAQGALMIQSRSKLVVLALAGATAFIVGATPNLIARGAAAALEVVQDPPPPAQDPETTPGRGGRGGQAAAPRPYAQVITSAAKTDEGIFKVHRVADTLFYEI